MKIVELGLASVETKATGVSSSFDDPVPLKKTTGVENNHTYENAVDPDLETI